MKTNDLEYFGISRQNKSRWKLTNDPKYNIIRILEKLDINECRKFISESRNKEEEFLKLFNPKPLF